MVRKVAVLDDYVARAHELADWASLGDDVEVRFFTEALRGPDLVKELLDFDVIVLQRERTAFPREVLEQLQTLKLLITTGMGNASVDRDYLKQRGVTFCGTRVGGGSGAPSPGISTPSEMCWALIFAVTKGVVREHESLREGGWQVGFPVALRGLRLGVVGLGTLGKAMVAPARLFGMDIVAWSQNLTEERCAEVGIRLASREELFETSDVIVIQLLLSERSRGLINSGDIDRMKPTAFLVNTSRGPIIEEAPLMAALRGRRIAGAAFDVYHQEPLPPDHPLRGLDNVVLMPHLGYVSEAGFRNSYGQVVENIRGYFAGSPVRTID